MYKQYGRNRLRQTDSRSLSVNPMLNSKLISLKLLGKQDIVSKLTSICRQIDGTSPSAYLVDLVESGFLRNGGARDKTGAREF